MGGQNIERREALRMISIASVAAGFPGFRKWRFACGHALPAVSASEEGSEKTPYQPVFFSPQQYKLLSRMAEMIIPSDDSPGATDAGVPEFIDFMVANRVPIGSRHERRSDPPFRSVEEAMEAGKEAQERFVAGLAWVDAHSFSELGHEFLECTPQQQNTLLEELAYKDKFKPLSESGRDFFRLIRTYTVVGYYTSKIGLEALGYPGLRTVWPSMPGCSHPDDPEHVRLPNSLMSRYNPPKPK